MNATKTLNTDFQEALKYMEKSKDSGLTIFIADEDLFYLKLVNNILSENPKFEVHTFLEVEECLNYVLFKPNLVILDKNLDEKSGLDKKSDFITRKIKKSLPDTRVVQISSEDKLKFIEGLHAYDTCKLFYKESYIVKKFKGKI